MAEMNKPRLSVVSSKLPDPPYPKTTKANGFKPEVDWQLIRSSSTWRKCPADQKNNLLRLWLESWNEVPAGSWEDDDELIAAAIDMPVKAFQVHRDSLMRGWELHSDGRLYHPKVTEMVLSMLNRRRNSAARQAKARSKPKTVDQGLTGDVTRDSRVSHTASRVSNAAEQEQEQEQEEKKPPLPPLPDKPTPHTKRKSRAPAGAPVETPDGVDPEAWADWHDWRSRGSKSRDWRGKAITMAANTLRALSVEQQRETVAQSIQSGWTGLFPRNRNEGNGHTGNVRRESATDRRIRINAELEARARSHFPEMD